MRRRVSEARKIQFVFLIPEMGALFPTLVPTPLPARIFQFARLAPLLYSWHVPRGTQWHSIPFQNTSTTPTPPPTSPCFPNLIIQMNISPLTNFIHFHLVVFSLPDPIFNHKVNVMHLLSALLLGIM